VEQFAEKFVAYYRVSTDKQGKSGLGIEAQRESVRAYIAGRGTLVREYTEIETGKRSDRPKLTEALTLCRIYNARLVIAKIDRLARNVAFVSALMRSEAMFVAVDFPEANEFMVHILASVAEFEAKAISARTKAALAQSKKKLGGNPDNLRLHHAKGTAASARVRSAKASKRAQDMRAEIASIRESGATSLRQIATALNERNIPAARGGEWSSVQVMRVLAAA
jgi:DNA invertase Pin-like site-specific DNA recombinase